MDCIEILYPEQWNSDQYQLLDSGNGQKFEEFAGFKVIRPDPRVIWQPLNQNWQADAIFDRSSANGKWIYRKQPPVKWEIKYGDLRFKLKPTDFRHVGIFPEQAVNWDWLEKTINGQPLKILNLFAYTGASTAAAAKAGAKVTHVDSSKGIIFWAKENATLSGLPGDAIRWIPDDAYKFVDREGRRNAKYDGVILDPPRFGHGTGGEVWKLQDDLPKLLIAVKKILVEKPKFVLLSVYTADLSAIAILQLVQGLFGEKGEVAELAIKESGSERLVPNGIVCRNT